MGPEPNDIQRPKALAIALLASAAKRFDVADEFYEIVAGQPPNADAAIWTAWGLEMLLAERNDRAIEIFQTMVDKEIGRRQRGEVLYYLSGALALDKRFDEALEAAKRAARLSRRIPAIQLRPAWVLYIAERWDEADKAYRKFLEDHEDGQSPAARAAVREAKMTLSNISIYREKFEASMEWLEQVLDEYPNDVGASNDLGYLWADRGIHLERSLRMARKAVEAEPENIAYLDSVGWSLYRLGRFDEAVKELQKAAAVDEPDPIILDHLGDALQQSGDVSQARETWQRALPLLKDQDKQKKKIESKLEQYISE
jgi:tetratricopeptide (TPR) repeat protein